MKFPEVVQKVGIRLAIDIFKDVKGENFEDKVTFVEWAEVIEIVGNDLYWRFKLARTRLQPLAITYDEWKLVLDRTFYAHNENDQRKEVMTKLFSVITSIKDCKDFWRICSNRLFDFDWTDPFRLALIEKASKLAQSFSDWLWVSSIIEEPGETTTLCIENMEKLAVTFDDWHHIHERWNHRPEVKERAFKKLVELAKK